LIRAAKQAGGSNRAIAHMFRCSEITIRRDVKLLTTLGLITATNVALDETDTQDGDGSTATNVAPP
jgi:DeoR/GlpR family transcriptional regulator of sugar metabolism